MVELLKIPYALTKIDEAPSPLRLFYAPQPDGSFQLAVDHPDTARVKEFREHNKALQKQLRDLGELDPAEHARLKAEAETQATQLTAAEAARVAAVSEVDRLKGQLAAFGDLDPVAAREALGKPALDGRVSELESALAAEKTARDAEQFKHLIAWDFLKAGGRPEALDFVVTKAAETFAMKNGKVTTAAFSAKEPGTPLSVPEWIERQGVDHAFAFKPSKGGGADPQRSHGPTARIIDRQDPFAFGMALEDIASGKASVR